MAVDKEDCPKMHLGTLSNFEVMQLLHLGDLLLAIQGNYRQFNLPPAPWRMELGLIKAKENVGLTVLKGRSVLQL